MVIKSLEIQNRSYYFWDDRIYIEDFDPRLLKINKKESLLNIEIYYIGYVTKKEIYNNNSVNPLYLVIRVVEGYVEAMVGYNYRNLVITSIDDYEIINENKADSVASKSIVIPSSDENEKVLSKSTELWNYIESKKKMLL